MIDLSHSTIKSLFEEQILLLTRNSLISKEEYFDFQFSEGWLR